MRSSDDGGIRHQPDSIENVGRASPPTMILVLEDEPIIAIDIEAMIEDYGLGVSSICASEEEALDWLRGNKPGVAIVDPRLSDGLCKATVRRLVELDVPFVVYSGELDGPTDSEPAFSLGELVPKPCPPNQLFDAVIRAFLREGS